MQAVLARYEARTPKSKALMEKSRQLVAGGVSRNMGYHVPYPVANQSGDGGILVDVDGNDYVDFVFNGMSLIHGHAYAPVVDEIEAAMKHGWAWPGTSEPQIAFAQMLASRIPGMNQVRFTNSGNEATMLAVKLARHHTQRPLILKATAAYHGTYPDLEAGLHGQGELPGRTLIAPFGDIDAFASVIARHKDQLAAVIIEPVLITGGVVPPPPGFLPALCDLAREAGVLTVLDDCLMFRLAYGGSSAHFNIRPDIVALGKFIGGGIPTGAVCGPSQIMRHFEPESDRALYHGGSFNGNILSCRAGAVCLSALDQAAIADMNTRAERLRAFLATQVARRGLHAEVTGIGSVFGIGFPEPGHTRQDYYAGESRDLAFHLACLCSGIQPGAGGYFSLATSFDAALMDEAERRLEAAFDLFEDSMRALLL
jgi:glutamate-1-semialdehyde 2,1-aminomutase